MQHYYDNRMKGQGGRRSMKGMIILNWVSRERRTVERRETKNMAGPMACRE